MFWESEVILSMDIHLLAFVTVAEEHSFTLAAEKLRISQPAISQHVQTLEKRLDVQLFDRNKRNVRLTKAGQVAYKEAKEILNSYSRMTRLIEDLRSKPSGPIAIGASFTFGEYVLPHLIADFRKRYPEVEPTVQIQNTRAVAELVSNGDLDIGIVEGSTSSLQEIAVEPLAADHLVLVCASDHPLAGREVITEEDLKSAPWIIREVGSGTREITEVVFEQFQFRPPVIQEFTSTQLIKESVLAGLGITLLSRWTVHRELQWQALVELKLPGLPAERAFSMILTKSGFRTRVTSSFQSYLLEQKDRLTKGGWVSNWFGHP